MIVTEHGFEPVRGLPSLPPNGERVIWQGAPDWRVLAPRLFHTRAITLWFTALAGWRFAATLSEGAASLTDYVMPVVMMAAFGAVAVGLLTLLAWAIARTTVYTLTTRRLVLKIGVALPITINVPYALVDGANLKSTPSGHGDIALKLAESGYVSWAILWPHVRPWRLRYPEPMLRAVPDAGRVATLLSEAVAATAPEEIRLAKSAPAPEAAPVAGPETGGLAAA